MQTTSAAYKSEQKQPLREKSYVWVYLGVVDRYAQKAAEFDSAVTDWSKVPTGNELVEDVYATYEQNFFRADGSMRFPPEENWAMYQGAASEAIGAKTSPPTSSLSLAFDGAFVASSMTWTFFDNGTPNA